MNTLAPNEVRVWTQQTTFLPKEEIKPMERPYARIVAMDLGDHTQTCKDIGDVALDGFVETTIQLKDALQADRLKTYFNEVIAPNDPTLAGVRARREADYDCFSLLQYLREGIKRGRIEATRWIDEHPPRYVPLVGALVLGQEGYVVTRFGRFNPTLSALHGFLALENGRNLAVLSAGGTLGMNSLDDVEADFSDPEDKALLVGAVYPEDQVG